MVAEIAAPNPISLKTASAYVEFNAHKHAPACYFFRGLHDYLKRVSRFVEKNSQFTAAFVVDNATEAAKKEAVHIGPPFPVTHFTAYTRSIVFILDVSATGKLPHLVTFILIAKSCTFFICDSSRNLNWRGGSYDDVLDPLIRLICLQPNLPSFWAEAASKPWTTRSTSSQITLEASEFDSGVFAAHNALSYLQRQRPIFTEENKETRTLVAMQMRDAMRASLEAAVNQAPGRISHIPRDLRIEDISQGLFEILVHGLTGKIPSIFDEPEFGIEETPVPTSRPTVRHVNFEQAVISPPSFMELLCNAFIGPKRMTYNNVLESLSRHPTLAKLNPDTLKAMLAAWIKNSPNLFTFDRETDEWVLDARLGASIDTATKRRLLFNQQAFGSPVQPYTVRQIYHMLLHCPKADVLISTVRSSRGCDSLRAITNDRQRVKDLVSQVYMPLFYDKDLLPPQHTDPDVLPGNELVYVENYLYNKRSTEPALSCKVDSIVYEFLATLNKDGLKRGKPWIVHAIVNGIDGLQTTLNDWHQVYEDFPHVEIHLIFVLDPNRTPDCLGFMHEENVYVGCFELARFLTPEEREMRFLHLLQQIEIFKIGLSIEAQYPTVEIDQFETSPIGRWATVGTQQVRSSPKDLGIELDDPSMTIRSLRRIPAEQREMLIKYAESDPTITHAELRQWFKQSLGRSISHATVSSILTSKGEPDQLPINDTDRRIIRAAVHANPGRTHRDVAVWYLRNHVKLITFDQIEDTLLPKFAHLDQEEPASVARFGEQPSGLYPDNWDRYCDVMKNRYREESDSDDEGDE